MQYARFISSFAGIILFCASLLVATGAAASTGTFVPGIVDPSLPQFVNDVRVRANRGNWTIRGNRNFTFETVSALWTVNGSFKLNASFDSVGDLLPGGTVSIVGRIPGLVNSRELLMSADLISFGASADGAWLGFNTDNIFCSPSLGVTCTTSESVLIELLGRTFAGDPNARFRSTGIAITSVPLPAALLLFVSGLGWLATAARRRSALS